MRIKKVEIRNFRGIKSLDWAPLEGLNLLVGHGDVGKSTVLDAIDCCLNFGRYEHFYDYDFYNFDCKSPIEIAISIGDLPDDLLNLERYALYIRGFDAVKKEVHDEPQEGLETILTVRLTVDSDLSYERNLYSERASQDGNQIGLPKQIREAIRPVCFGVDGGEKFNWARGSLMQRLVSLNGGDQLALRQAVRELCKSDSVELDEELDGVLNTVEGLASELSIDVGRPNIRVDAKEVKLGWGAFALHDSNSIPLRSLGTGSTRLLSAALLMEAYRKANEASDENGKKEFPFVLIDEMEFGLEPMRQAMLLLRMGAKTEEINIPQSFITSHSRVALTEVPAEKVWFLHKKDGKHHMANLNDVDMSNSICKGVKEPQAVARTAPEAFFAKRVVVCEGKSEVGFLRGFDSYFHSKGEKMFRSNGVEYIDAHGGDAPKDFEYWRFFNSIGIDVCILCDNDRKEDKKVHKALYELYPELEGRLFRPNEGDCLESALIKGMSEDTFVLMLKMASWLEENEGHNQECSIISQFLEKAEKGVTESLREEVAERCSIKKWFKDISKMEYLVKELIGKDFEENMHNYSPHFKRLLDWIRRA